MDTRNRQANKRYRNRLTNKYQTVSLTLDHRLLNLLEKRISKEKDSNMSRYIEYHVTEFYEKMSIKEKNKLQIQRRQYKTLPQKKTFTFTIEFKDLISLSGNMSVFVETILAKELSLDLQ